MHSERRRKVNPSERAGRPANLVSGGLVSWYNCHGIPIAVYRFLDRYQSELVCLREQISLVLRVAGAMIVHWWRTSAGKRCLGNFVEAAM